MLIFMVESGDTGFQFSKTSSKFFVLVNVYEQIRTSFILKM